MVSRASPLRLAADEPFGRPNVRILAELFRASLHEPPRPISETPLHQFGPGYWLHPASSRSLFSPCRRRFLRRQFRLKRLRVGGVRQAQRFQMLSN